MCKKKKKGNSTASLWNSLPPSLVSMLSLLLFYLGCILKWFNILWWQSTLAIGHTCNRFKLSNFACHIDNVAWNITRVSIRFHLIEFLKIIRPHLKTMWISWCHSPTYQQYYKIFNPMETSPIQGSKKRYPDHAWIIFRWNNVIFPGDKMMHIPCEYSYQTCPYTFQNATNIDEIQVKIHEWQSNNLLSNENELRKDKK